MQHFTMLPLDLLGYALTPAAFGVLLYLYRCAGREGRAFPSRRRIGRFLDMAKSTVGAALSALKNLGLFIRCRCLRRRGDYSMNSYHMTNMAAVAGASNQEAPAISPAEGVGRNLNYASQEQDNGGFYLEGKKNRNGLIRQFEQFWRENVFPGETLGPPGKQTKSLRNQVERRGRQGSSGPACCQWGRNPLAGASRGMHQAVFPRNFPRAEPVGKPGGYSRKGLLFPCFSW